MVEREQEGEGMVEREQEREREIERETMAEVMNSFWTKL